MGGGLGCPWQGGGSSAATGVAPCRTQPVPAGSSTGSLQTWPISEVGGASESAHKRANRCPGSEV